MQTTSRDGLAGGVKIDSRFIPQITHAGDPNDRDAAGEEDVFDDGAAGLGGVTRGQGQEHRALWWR